MSLYYPFSMYLYTNKKSQMFGHAHAVTAIYKGKGSPTNCSNYRPISLTCITCKILEAIIRENLLNHFTKNNLLIQNQFGFRPGRSTTSQLLDCMNDWTKTMDRRGQTDIIYLDFAKAFDTVPHQKLLIKLESMGVRGHCLGWIRAFLTNRSQVVLVEGVSSTPAPVTSGVPQGCVCSPIYFLSYINDMLFSLNSSKGQAFRRRCKNLHPK